MKHLKSYLLIAFSFLLLLQSCTDDPNKKIIIKPAFKQSPLDSVYADLRPKIQTFTIDNKKATIVKAVNGTAILVPANCFVDGNGDMVTGNVKLEIVEAFSLADFIISGLATISGDKMLISNGMIYINATSGDTRLQLSKGAALSVSMPTMNYAGGFQMFTGDGTDWKVDSAMTETDYTMPLPLNLLYPQGNSYLWHCLTSYPNGDDKWAYYDTTVISFTDPKYENTIIATPEFQRRVWQLSIMTMKMSYFVNRDYYFDKADCFDQKDNNDLFKVYYDYPNRSFAVSDSIARKMYIDYFNANEDKIAAFCEEVNKHKREYYTNWTDTNYYFDFRKTSLKDDYMADVKFFPPPNTKEIKHINDHGINLNAANAFDLLKAKGVDEKEINEILTYNFQRDAIIKMLQRQKDARADKEKIAKMYESTLFSVTTMGWINCDRFFDDPSAGKAEMYVSNGSGTDLKFIDCSLVIPEMNVRLSAYEDQPGRYSFTQKDGRYIKLPIGKAAVIVGVAVQHDSLFFASQKITIKDGYAVSLPMHYTNSKALNDSLKIALK
jgi:hypothetical protein